MSGFSLNPSSFTLSRNGRALFAYTGIKTIGGTSDTILEIANTGLDDLLVKATAAADWEQVTDYLGFDISIDDEQIFLHVNSVATPPKAPPPWTWEFICPAQSKLKSVTTNGAGSAGASRSLLLIAYPLLVMQS